jgi:competence protein ComEA
MIHNPKSKGGKMPKRRQITVLWVVLMSLILASAAFAADVEKININTASAEELTQLNGIGASHAAAIIDYREKNGPFQKSEDLMKVPRIGEKTFEKNKDMMSVQTSKKGSAIK